MNILQHYLENKADSKYLCVDFSGTPASIFIVIPCYNEPDLIRSLDSLSSCLPVETPVAVIVVINSSEDSSADVLLQNELTLSQIKSWKVCHSPYFGVYVLHVPDLPRKFAGVGWARKIGMDAAVQALVQSGQEDGILVSFDADSTVSPDYLRAIEQNFKQFPKKHFFTIHFAHPIEAIGSQNENEGILRYELHMRYFRNAVQWTGYPHAIHTVGSSFAVKASAYAKQGGMNRKKAGEDFYFLHKLVLLGDYGNIHTATVFPSPRQSDRVPFGTGAAMKKWGEGNPELLSTYNFNAFFPLKTFFANYALFFGMNEDEIHTYFDQTPIALKQFVEESGTIRLILELQKNCANASTFSKRFFHHLNAFWILKFLNFAHEKYFIRGELYSQAIRLLEEKGIPLSSGASASQLLEHYRNLDKEL